jgi:hypothetical protein
MTLLLMAIATVIQSFPACSGWITPGQSRDESQISHISQWIFLFRPSFWERTWLWNNHFFETGSYLKVNFKNKHHSVDVSSKSSFRNIVIHFSRSNASTLQCLATWLLVRNVCRSVALSSPLKVMKCKGHSSKIREPCWNGVVKCVPLMYLESTFKGRMCLHWYVFYFKLRQG